MTALGPCLEADFFKAKCSGSLLLAFIFLEFGVTTVRALIFCSCRSLRTLWATDSGLLGPKLLPAEVVDVFEVKVEVDVDLLRCTL